MNKAKQTESNRMFWRMIKIAFMVTVAVTFMSVDSILTSFGL